MNTDYYIDMNMKLWIENGVFHVKIFVETFSLAMAQVGVKERVRMCGGTAFPMLSDCRKVKLFDKEARDFLAQPQNTVCISAGAILISSQLQKIIANFFIQLNKPPAPAKMFTDEAEALNWLQQFKKIRSTA
jgi:hypothetical protein